MNEPLSDADYAGFLVFAAQERQEALLLELAGVLDSFDRVLAAGPDPDPAAGHERLRMLTGQLERFARSMGLEPVGAVGEDFEPAVHQAAEVRPVAAGARADEVLEVLQRGYRHSADGRLLRPARVAVADVVQTADAVPSEADEAGNRNEEQ
ncbi:Protein GrpE [Streptomyces sp. RB5]|uniref:Protein GrpE n=1 Tax=Streptomyces smaragdinus TaxID=2585196 RepID=A0A7K0CGU6_9ACTN|nr:nucleotide exchange factor GrpE [Streptomyces smaragdinus]MQY12593.1 Protein GrpE [Streptomyces smaragdinus]